LYNMEHEDINNLINEGYLSLIKNKITVPFVLIDKSVTQELQDKYPFLKFANFTQHLGPLDFERFVPQFFTFKQNLFVCQKIHKTTFGNFFSGCYMNQKLAGTTLDLGTKMMKYEESVHTDIHKKLPQVKIRDLPNRDINVQTTPTTVWVGKNCKEFDFCMFFKNATVKGEIKSTSRNAQIALGGNSKNSFEQERKRAMLGPVKIHGRPPFFLFVTNAIMTENKKKIVDVVKNDSMLVNSTRWENTFTSLFWFHHGQHTALGEGMEIEGENIEKEKSDEEEEVIEKEKSEEVIEKEKSDEEEEVIEKEKSDEEKEVSEKEKSGKEKEVSEKEKSGKEQKNSYKRKRESDVGEQESEPKKKGTRCVGVCKTGEQCKKMCLQGNLCWHHKSS